MTTTQDFRKGQKVIATFEIDDRGQDFTELDLLENGVLLGNSLMFSHGRLSLLGIGTLDGMEYYSFEDVKNSSPAKTFKGLYVYIKPTGDKDPLPWKADTLSYPVTGRQKVIKANRFVKAK